MRSIGLIREEKCEGLLTSKNHVNENFDVIGIQRRFVSFPDKMLLRNRPAFHSKEKSRGYSVYSYSRIVSIERALKIH